MTEGAEAVMTEIARLLVRAEAAERRARELEAAMERHTHSFTDPRGIVLCGGCLEAAPCPDAGLISSDEEADRG